MEFDNYVSKLQGALISLASRGILNSSGSTETINILKETVQDAPEDAKLKLTFFMVLNTKLTVSEEIKKDDNVGLFVNVSPPIEKNYLIDYVYELKLQSHLNNIIENCPSAISLEIIETVIGKLKQASFHKDEYGFEHIYSLWRSIFTKIYKTEKTENNCSEKLILYFGELFNLIETVVKTSLKICENNLGHFIGSHFYYLFDAILFFLNLYKNEDFNYEKCEIYNLTIDLENKTEKPAKEPCWKCIKIVFDKIGKILEFLTVDSWMLLSSCYFESDSTKSMQQLIGECIYKICEAVKGLSISPDVVSCLSACKIKPKEESERIAEADIEEIISNVEKGNKEWFRGLVKHPDIFEKRSITCIMNHIDLGTSDDVEFILERSFSYLQTQDLKTDENLDSVKQLFLKAVKKSNDCYKWLEVVFSNYKSSLLETSNFSDELVETFNKISDECSISNSDLVYLCMQSPVETVKKICKLAACSRYTHFFVKALKALQPACEVIQSFEEGQKPQRLLDFVLLKFVLHGDFTDKENDRLVMLIGGLAEKKLINEEFFKKLIETLNENLESERFDKANFCLEIWLQLAERKTFDVDKHVLLVMLSQVLDHLSWDLKTYSTVKAKCRDLVAIMVTRIFEKLEDDDDSQLEWTRQEVSKTGEISQAYFCDLWFRFGHKWGSSRKFYILLLALSHSCHGGVDIKKALFDFCKSKDSSEVRASIALSLTLLLPVCTLSECHSMFSHLVSLFSDLYPEKNELEVDLDILDALLSSLYLLSLHMSGKEGFRSCHEHCVRICGLLIRRCIFGMNASLCVGIIEKMSFCLNAIEDHDERESCSVILSPVLLELVDRVVIREYDKSLREKITRLVKVLDVKDVTEAVNQRLRD